MKWLVSVMMLGMVTGSHYPKADATKREQEKLRGTWKLVSATDGRKQDSEDLLREKWVSLAFSGDRLDIRHAHEKPGHKREATYSLDLNTTPKTLIWRFDASFGTEVTYAIQGDLLELRLVNLIITEPGGEQSRVEVGGNDGSDQVVFTLKRESH